MSATTEPTRRLTVSDIAKLYADGTRIAMLTAYDYPTAMLLDEAGIPMLLVGDSLGEVILGYDSTIRVTMAEMLHHTKAVVRGTRRPSSSATCRSCILARGRSRTPACSSARAALRR
jgi:ketopantoate hydroxymethyltransferase